MSSTPSEGGSSAESAGTAASGDGDPTAPAAAAPATREPSRPPAPRRTRAGAAWVGISIAVLVLILLVVFIAQNTHQVKISFLWLDGSFPLGLALLVAAVAGALIAIVAGSTRILQLRHATTGRRGARGRLGRRR